MTEFWLEHDQQILRRRIFTHAYMNTYLCKHLFWSKLTIDLLLVLTRVIFELASFVQITIPGRVILPSLIDTHCQSIEICVSSVLN